MSKLDINTPAPMVSTLREDIDLFNPDPDQFRLTDIAWSMSGINRYNGHVSKTISVAAHSLLCEYILKDVLANSDEDYGFSDMELRRTILFHDASEYLLGDINRPLKRALGAVVEEAETRIYDRMADKYKLINPMPRIIKTVDNMALATEVDYAAPTFKTRWTSLPEPHEGGKNYIVFLTDMSRHAQAQLLFGAMKDSIGV